VNIQYVPKSSALVVWGLVLSVVGAGLSSWLSVAAVGETIRDAASMFYDSSAGAYAGWAVLFGLVSVTGFILLAVGAGRVLNRIDQKYEAWFRSLPAAPAAGEVPRMVQYPQAAAQGQPLPQPAQVSYPPMPATAPKLPQG
jgi:hypothetical protein